MQSMKKRIRSDAAAVTNKQHVFRFRTKSQRQIGEQSHVALAHRARARHRNCIRQQPVAIRFAEKIVPQQLIRCGITFYPLDYPCGKMAFAIRFVRTAGMCEMLFIAMERKNCEDEYRGRPEPDDD